jgi:acyl-CoA thioesterase II
MGDFAFDTALPASPDGRFELVLSRDWEIWGPNGGYMAALALRAAGLSCGRSRPANVTVHFLGVASFDAPVSIECTTLRAARAATSVSVTISQNGKPVLQAMVWAIDDGLAGLEHDEAPMPPVEPWSGLPTIQERAAERGEEWNAWYPFWNNFEQRPLDWVADWDNREFTEPLYRNWMRFVGADAAADDAWTFAARLLLLVDLGGWPSVGRRHDTSNFIAPSIDVSCEFHRMASRNGWFMLEGHSPFAGDGLVASHQRVWNDSGQLLASGISHLLCKRIG